MKGNITPVLIGHVISLTTANNPKAFDEAFTNLLDVLSEHTIEGANCGEDPRYACDDPSACTDAWHFRADLISAFSKDYHNQTKA